MRRLVFALCACCCLVPAASAEEAVEPVTQARELLLDDRPQEAIDLLQAMLSDAQLSADRRAAALEYLGVASERLPDRPRARAFYERYLAEHPNASGATRVRQRLRSLLELAPLAASALPARRLQIDASIGQDYWRDRWLLADIDEVSANSGLLSNLFVAARYEARDVAVGARLNLDHLLTLDAIAARTDARSTEWRASEAYLEVGELTGRWQVRAGRQSSYRDGVQGRFSGVAASYRFREGLSARLTSGLAIDGPRYAADASRPFIAAAVDATRGPLRASLFAYTARSDGLIDRRGAGAEMGLAWRRLRVRGLLDYELAYGELNAAFVQADLVVNQRLRGYARGHAYAWPRYSVRNALTARAVQPLATRSLDALDALYSDAEIRALARANTGDARALQGGLTWRVSQRHTLVGDVQYLRLLARRDEAPLDEAQLVWRLDWITSGVARQGDQWRLSSGVLNSRRADEVFVSLQSRLPLPLGMRAGPTLDARYRLRGTATREATRLVPGLRVDWRARRLFVRLEVKRDWRWLEPLDALPGVTEETRGWSALLSWRLDT
ncbi:MAG: hypothetical protein AAF515_06645 [Pseudomonadota bacterium]